MNNQSDTTVRELDLEDLACVSGAGIVVADFHGRGAIGPEFAGIRGVIGPEVAGVRGAVGPDI